MEQEQPSLAVCPACVAMPPSDKIVPKLKADATEMRRIELSLPSVHCAACIANVERALAARPDVFGARVNLTLKRVSITGADSVGIEDDLIEHLAKIGYPALPLDSAALEKTRTDKVGRDLLARVAVAGFAAMNVMLLSVSVWSGATDATRDLMHWISAIIAIPTIAFSGMPFFKSAWSALRVRRLNMDVPISLALILATGVSLAETLEHGEHAYFDAALSLTFFLLLGRYLDHRTRAVARSAASELAALEVQKAQRILPDGRTETVPMDALSEGDILLVSAGARVPVDGVITNGSSELDPSMLTGETLPEAVTVGAQVHAGMMNISGPLHIKTVGLGEETLLKQITRLVETAETAKNKYTSLAEKAAQIYAPAVHLLSAGAFIGWGLATGDWRLAVNIAAAVLIITCPCALGLAVPAVLAAASGRMFRQGVLLKDGVALEKLADIDMVVFDKTGTLTTGQPQVLNANDIPEAAQAIAADLARGSSHPLSKAIANRFATTGNVTSISEHPGFGTEGLLGGQKVRLGRANWCGYDGEPPTQTATWLKIGNAAPIAILFQDQLRPEAKETVTRLLSEGLQVLLLSGDVPAQVRSTAEALGITDWVAQATPSDKVDRLAELAADGQKVLMVGDGLNDAAALAAAHVSISPASAVDASRTSADMIIVNNDLTQIVQSYRIARAAKRRILENFTVAAVYNMVSIPFALAGFATPLMAALAMSASSITVSLNAMRVGRMK
ncbi:MAG: cadmium-translocating P-type ATPase [Rhodobacteraceae bacterium]|nr:cadmium-translocating P-type ATPase [Paracoccaceae bacterium]